MDLKKVLCGIDTVITGLETLKDGLNDADNTEDTKEIGDSTPKKPVKATKAVSKKAEPEESDGEEVDYATMKYNDLKKLAVERGLKKPNVGKAELIAFLTGEPLDDANEEADEVVESETPENVDETDEEDLTQKVTDMLEDVETEELANFLTENGISAKGKRPSLIAKLVVAIEDGDISLDDLVVEDDKDEEVEEAPAPKKSEKAKKSPKKAEPEPEPEDDEEDEEDDYTYGYTYNKKKDIYVDDEEEDKLLSTVTAARMDALREYITTVKKDITNKSKKKNLLAELSKFFGEEIADDDNEIIGSAVTMFLLMTDDEGETHEAKEPYEINGISVCCGQALTQTDDGWVCEICGEEYEDDDE